MIDSLFFADSPGVEPFRARFMSQSGFDPIDLLAALAPVTEHIGLLATASTTYSSPWDLARRFASLDHLSKGRAGWNIVTTGNPLAAANFADRPHPEHADRYQRAEEFVEVVLKVWDGWEDDAVLASREQGEWADHRKLIDRVRRVAPSDGLEAFGGADGAAQGAAVRRDEGARDHRRHRRRAARTGWRT